MSAALERAIGPLGAPVVSHSDEDLYELSEFENSGTFPQDALGVVSQPVLDSMNAAQDAKDEIIETLRVPE